MPVMLPMHLGCATTSTLYFSSLIDTMTLLAIDATPSPAISPPSKGFGVMVSA
jgi:hypothetical protein